MRSSAAALEPDEPASPDDVLDLIAAAQREAVTATAVLRRARTTPAVSRATDEVALLGVRLAELADAIKSAKVALFCRAQHDELERRTFEAESPRDPVLPRHRVRVLYSIPIPVRLPVSP